MRTRNFLTVAFLLSSFSVLASAQQTYRLTDLGTLGGTYSQVNGAYSINASGQATGYFDTYGIVPAHAFLWDGAVMQDLGTLGGTYSGGNAIHASGLVTGGASTIGDAEYHAFLSDGFTMQDLGDLGGTYSEGYAINASGQVVGYASVVGDLHNHAFFWNGTSMQDLGTLGRTDSVAASINDSGDVAGYAYTPSSGDIRAFLWDGTALQDLGTLGGTLSAAFLVSNSGVVAGWSDTTGNAARHAFVWDGATMQDIDTLGSADSFPVAINASGHLTGCAQQAGSGQHAFFWDGVAMQDLGTLGGWHSCGNAINEAGWVTGSSVTTNDVAGHAFVWDGTTMHDLNALVDSADPLQPYVKLFVGMAINDIGQIAANGCDSRTNECHAYLVSPITGVDTTPPIVQSSASGTLGNGGWYVSDVQLTWDVSDTDSPISNKTTGCNPFTRTTDTKGIVRTCVATSDGGMTVASFTVKRDATPPTAKAKAIPAANAAGWRMAPVTVTYTGTDKTSKGVDCDAPAVLSNEAPSQSASGYCYDAAGNQSALATVAGINIDLSAPEVLILAPAEGATYSKGAVVLAQFSCNDPLSGVIKCDGTMDTGQPIKTNTKGTKTFKINAKDAAGNVIQSIVNYAVN